MEENNLKKAMETISAHLANCATGATRAIAVLDRGWIFVGDLAFDKESKMYTMTNAKNIRKWEKGGFGALSKSAKDSGAVMDNCAPLKFSHSAMVFAVPVGGDWDE